MSEQSLVERLSEVLTVTLPTTLPALKQANVIRRMMAERAEAADTIEALLTALSAARAEERERAAKVGIRVRDADVEQEWMQDNLDALAGFEAGCTAVIDAIRADGQADKGGGR